MQIINATTEIMLAYSENTGGFGYNPEYTFFINREIS